MPTKAPPEPDAAFVQIGPTDEFQAAKAGSAEHMEDAQWERAGCRIGWTSDGGSARLTLAAAGPVSRLALRWKTGVAEGARVFGDAWERTYGDATWDGIVPHRVLPWLWLALDADTHRTIGAGVRTGPGAWCSWTVDVDGITFWADVRSGIRPVQLGDRKLFVADLVWAESADRPYAALTELTAALAPESGPRKTGPVVGANNWYYAYGHGFDADAVVGDARTIVRLADGHPVAPYSVIDAGWGVGDSSCDGGPWATGKGSFTDMRTVADRIVAEGARPGLWYRPLLSREPTDLTHPVRTDAGYPLDPSRPAVLDAIEEDVRRFRDWGYELIKHDFSTFDVTGAFAPAFGATMGPGLFTFADSSRTTAEIILAFYRRVADAAGDTAVIGCNTVGHLAAGLVDIQRIGDDTSGKQWERTRRMGVNALAARLPQHGRFFCADADCVPATPQTPWRLNRQFLDLVAHSGTALFLSIDPRSLDKQVTADIRTAVRLALDGGTPGGVEPLDVLGTATPRRWRLGDREVVYDWSGPLGAESFIHHV
jgi:alpha-galactosidase